MMTVVVVVVKVESVHGSCVVGRIQDGIYHSHFLGRHRETIPYREHRGHVQARSWLDPAWIKSPKAQLGTNWGLRVASTMGRSQHL